MPNQRKAALERFNELWAVAQEIEREDAKAAGALGFMGPAP
jgi:hypothetical protein